jgi:hypothetical protein
MSSPPIALPRDIANSLKYLKDTDLHRLKSAVEAEIARREAGASTRKDKAAARPASRPVSASSEAARVAEIPEGKANLIRASFEAGLKAPTIARTFGVSVSMVNRIIRSI